jgi:hypothetical protein
MAVNLPVILSGIEAHSFSSAWAAIVVHRYRCGRLMNLVDIYRLMRNAHIQAQSIVDTIPEPLLVLDNHHCVESVNRSRVELEFLPTGLTVEIVIPVP